MAGAGSYVYSRQHFYDERYRHGDPQCASGDGSRASGGCTANFSLSEELFRDDLVGVTFTPTLFEYPLTVTILEVSGPEFEAHRICQPSGWCSDCTGDSNQNGSNFTWEPPPHQDVFFTLSDAKLDPPMLHCIDPVTGSSVIAKQCVDDRWCEMDDGECISDATIVIGMVVAFSMLCVVPSVTYAFWLYTRGPQLDSTPSSVRPPTAYGQPKLSMDGEVYTCDGYVDYSNLEIVVPEGCKECSTICVQLPTGRSANVFIPPGRPPGSVLAVRKYFETE